MKLVVGLGNPGEQYRGTRHNVGFDVVDRLARQHRVAFEMAPVKALQAKWRTPDPGPDVVLLVKPLTFVNLSGEAVGGLCRYYKVALADLLVICDDVNLPLGRLRARAGGSDGGHNGLKSLTQHLGTSDYARLRAGVGRGEIRRDLADHVLARFEPDERPGIEDAVTRAASAVETWVDDGLAKMMNIFNRVGDST
jgi:PTH1 family peptidyl-tRNA hydrolase